MRKAEDMMDPQVALEEINASACRQAIADLLEWKRRGGFRPRGFLAFEYRLKRDCDQRDVPALEEIQEWLIAGVKEQER